MSVERGQLQSSDPDAIADIARDALAQGEEELAAPVVLATAMEQHDPRLWQWAGLLHRALDDHAVALDCFAEAARLAPADASVAHGLAHVALEAGIDAEALFERARALAPDNRAVLIGQTAARMAAGHGVEAIVELEEVLDAEPFWIDGHRQFAQLSSLLGRQTFSSASLERAVAKFPTERSLWLAWCDLSLRREKFRLLEELVARAAAAVGGADLDFYRAVAAGELGNPNADTLLSAQAADENPALGVWRIRHLLRQDRARDCLPLIDRELRSARQSATWPYAAVAWRMMGDPRSQWLDDRPGLVAVIDMAEELAPLAPLNSRLRALHDRSGQFLDQSVRGGSQTDGPLLSRIEPEFRKLRAAVSSAAAHYVSTFPGPDPDHPLLGPPRNRRIRFAGSWSVRLRDGGRHANHVHPQGWISSALYISLPPPHAGDLPDSGALILGQTDTRLNLGMAPTMKIPPKEGQLVLFPSWMWHGTRPFAEGERLTVAFDVARPR